MREHSGSGNATYLRLTIGLEAYRITRRILAARDHVMFLSEIYWSHFICRAHLFLAEGKENPQPRRVHLRREIQHGAGYESRRASSQGRSI